MCSSSPYKKQSTRDRKIFKDILYEMAPFYYTTKLFCFSSLSHKNVYKTYKNRMINIFIDILMYLLSLSFVAGCLLFQIYHMDDMPKDGFVIIDVGQAIAYVFYSIIVICSMGLFQFMRPKFSMTMDKFQNIDIRVSVK